MSSEQPGRATRIRILIDREDAPSESWVWVRGKGKEDQLWRDEITPSSTTSSALVDHLTALIEAVR